MTFDHQGFIVTNCATISYIKLGWLAEEDSNLPDSRRACLVVA